MAAVSADWPGALFENQREPEFDQPLVIIISRNNQDEKTVNN